MWPITGSIAKRVGFALDRANGASVPAHAAAHDLRASVFDDGLPGLRLRISVPLVECLVDGQKYFSAR